MTAIAYSSPFWYGSNAAFRAWGKELSDTLAAAGLVRAGDTGQVNWATINNPTAINTFPAYEIYRFDDALQATAPVFIKLEYGYGGALTVPSIALTVGTATLGNGTISGLVGPRVVMGTYIGLTQPLRPLLTNVCKLPGYVAVAHKRDATNNAYLPNVNAFFAVCRTVNDDGTNNGEGVMVMHSITSLNYGYYAHCLGFAEGFVSGDHPGYGTIPNLITQQLQSSATDANTVQLFKIYGIFPRVRPIPQLCLVARNDLAENQISSHAMQGATNNSYLCLGYSASKAGWWGNDDNVTMAMMYQ